MANFGTVPSDGTMRQDISFGTHVLHPSMVARLMPRWTQLGLEVRKMTSYEEFDEALQNVLRSSSDSVGTSLDFVADDFCSLEDRPSSITSVCTQPLHQWLKSLTLGAMDGAEADAVRRIRVWSELAAVVGSRVCQSHREYSSSWDVVLTAVLESVSAIAGGAGLIQRCKEHYSREVYVPPGTTT